MPIRTAEERVGTLVGGKYRLDKILGAGGMGVVYAATHTWTDRPVAVKLLHHETAREPSVAQRFLQEARSAANIRHPNVVDVLDMGQSDEDGSVYLVLEMLDGECLSARTDSGPISVETALRVLLPIMDALEAAHGKGIVHRDMKPDNIFLSDNGAGQIVPKVLDFGIAKRNDSASLGVKTATGQLLGTPYYMSPEQARGAADLGPQSDVWSMGVVWFQCLSGVLPFNDDSLGGLIIKLVTTPAPLLSSVAPDVPRGIATVIDRALLLERTERHGSMADFALRIREAAREAQLDAPALASPRTSADTTGTRSRASSTPPPALAATEQPSTPSPLETMSAVARNPMDTGASARGHASSPRRAPPWLVVGVLLAAVGVTYSLAHRTSEHGRGSPATAAARAIPPAAVTPLPQVDPAPPATVAPAALPMPSVGAEVAQVVHAVPPLRATSVAAREPHGQPAAAHTRATHPRADTAAAAAPEARPDPAPASPSSGNRPGQIRNEW